MKKFVLFSLLLLTSGSLFWSCSKDNDQILTDESITVKDGILSFKNLEAFNDFQTFLNTATHEEKHIL